MFSNLSSWSKDNCLTPSITASHQKYIKQEKWGKMCSLFLFLFHQGMRSLKGTHISFAIRSSGPIGWDQNPCQCPKSTGGHTSKELTFPDSVGFGRWALQERKCSLAMSSSIFSGTSFTFWNSHVGRLVPKFFSKCAHLYPDSLLSCSLVLQRKWVWLINLLKN